MNYFDGLGKILIFVGLFLIAAGLIVLLVPKVPWMGKLPGDLFYKGDKFSIYFPITTSIIISIILTLLFYLFRR